MEIAVCLLATVTFCGVILGDLSGLYTQTTKPGELIGNLYVIQLIKHLRVAYCSDFHSLRCRTQELVVFCHSTAV